MKNDYEINKVYRDEFGRVSGIFSVDKPEGVRSHDVVYDYRRKLGTREVGHAGTLDPFASGLLIILAGKATKLFEQFLTYNKEYIAEIAFGVKTNTLDPEGEIVEVNNFNNSGNKTILKKNLLEVLNSFKPEYEQYVPIFSSVKVQGNKLRELARNTDEYIVEDRNGQKYIQFFKDGKVKKELPLPKKLVKIYEIELLDFSLKKSEDYLKPFNEKFINQLKEKNITSFQIAKIKVQCSKGTYIRKLAEDIGEKLKMSSMLIGLRRTRVGDISI